MSTRHLRLLGLSLVVACIAAFGAVGCNDSRGEDTSESAEAESAEESDESSSGQEGDAPSKDLYPGMNFRKLSADDRKTFVAVAKEELCPCEDSNESLHKCLQEGNSVCPIARRAATVIARSVNSGVGKEDILSRVADFLQEARKEHDFDLEDAPRRGPKDAPVRIVEFADFQCPHCKRASSMLEKLVDEHEGEVVHYFKHFPLPGHDKAKLAARATVAAQMQEKFWPMHDLLFENQQDFSREKILGFARTIGINSSKFKKDLESQKVAERVKSDKAEANEAKVSGTPAIFINGTRHMGSVERDTIADAIEAARSGEEDGDSNGDGGEEGGSDAGQ